MKDLHSMLCDLRRPGLLIRAARSGVAEYNRSPHLRRVLGSNAPERPAEAVMRLLEIEADLNAERLVRAAQYSTVRHVDVLVALMAEARLLPQRST